MKERTKKIAEDSFASEVNLKNEWNRLLGSIQKENKPVGKTRIIGKYLQMAAGYAAAVLVGAALVFVFTHTRTLPEQVQGGSFIVQTDNSDRSFTQLPDGSRIWLNKGTKIEYNQQFGIRNRNVLLNGEAYFEVAKNKKLAFVVKTKSIDVTALGTSFNVNAYDDGNEVTTTLYTGKVNVQSTLTGYKTILNPFEVAVFSKTKDKITTYVFTGPDKPVWMEPEFRFDMLPLIDITKQLEHNYNVVFVYRNQKIKHLKFSGTFDRDEKLDEILRVIKINTNIDYAIKNDSVIIK
ncbi:FecR family protein [Macellibacteroides fermentans]|uniref:FecR protein domain-containing protein n=1 Tax=bioreactor metagenome TaxID=1076179 RepID=A0A644V986_9ZZZZ|nr:FecR family protein [Macellibacteroides fermentans]HAD01034.1 anti-sigma factor [Porphyromonadaceae bacterium]HML70384.1 FecR family protein [Macellibacteroides fermentans]HRG13810.1 FecR family protein [Macellibacteroides fermentans]